MNTDISVVEKQELFSELPSGDWWKNTELFESVKHKVMGLRVAMTGDNEQGIVVNAVIQKPYPKHGQPAQALLYVNMDAGGMRVATVFPYSECYLVSESLVEHNH